VTEARRRHFGPTTLAALVVANMIGAGVFTTSGFALADLGSPGRVLAAWVVGGGIAICGAIGYGALARQLTASGGEYLFLSRVIHPAAGFVAGWISLLAGFTGAIAFAAHAFESYVRPEGSSLPPNLIAVLAIAVAAALHAVRARPGAWGQNLVVGTKLVALLVFVVLAAKGWSGGARAWPVCDPVPFSLATFAGSLVWISLSYSGFNAAVYVAGEARDPARTVPAALLRATIGVTLVYLLLNLVFVGFVPCEDVAGRPDVAFAAASSLLGDTGAQVVRAIVALALLSSVSSMIMAGPRVFAQMADDGLFPAALRFRGEVPTAAILTQAAIAILVVLVSDLQSLLGYLGLTLSLSAAFTVSCVFVLRRRQGAAAVPVSGSVVLPAIYVAATVGLALLASTRQPAEWGAAATTVVSGLIVYRLFRSRRAAGGRGS
jgi:APA family basic amino acid/polyamine antiporter